MCRVDPALAGEGGEGGFHAGCEPVHRESFTDESGRAHADLGRTRFGAFRGKERCNHLRSAVGVLESRGTCARVRSAGVQDDGSKRPGFEYLLGPHHRSCLEPIAREYPSRNLQWAIVHDQGDILRARGLKPCCDPCCTKATRGAHTHGAIPSIWRPIASSRPSMRLAFCNACPAAPLPRLSRALTMIARPECGSSAT